MKNILQLKSALLLLLMFVVVERSESQSRVKILRAYQNGEYVYCDVRATCNGDFADLDQEKLVVKENGKSITNFWVESPWKCGNYSAGFTCLIDQGLGMDSGSPSAMQEAKSTAKSFHSISTQIGIEDPDVTFLSFNDSISLLWRTRSVNQDAEKVIDTLTANGISAIWDALYETIRTRWTPGTVLVLISSGWDNSQHHTESEVIDSAAARDVRIYTVGVGAKRNDSLLKRLAKNTYGTYFPSPDSLQLRNLYGLGFRYSFEYDLVYSLSYPIPCSLDTLRTIELILPGTAHCPDTARTTFTYRATPQSPQTIDLSVEARSTISGGTVAIPLRLNTSAQYAFQPSMFDLIFDTSLARLDSIVLTKKLYDSDQVYFWKFDGKYRVRVWATQQLHIKEPLVTIWFSVFKQKKDTLMTIQVLDWQFFSGCLSGQTHCGILTILKNLTSIEATAAAQKDFHLFQNYPNPFTDRTTIKLSLLVGEGRGEVSLKLFDLFGREVLDLSDEARSNSQVTILKSQLPSSGMYFYLLTFDGRSQTKMMIVAP